MLTKARAASLVVLGLLFAACASDPDVDALDPVGEDALTGGRLETVPADEADDTRKLAALFTNAIRKDAVDGDGKARRGVHPKAHGCVKARVETTGTLPAGLSSPIFGEKAKHDAWIRFSNANRQMQDDHVGDARGMAIKMLGVSGPKVLGGPDANAETQDFTLQSNEVFLIRNVHDFLEFAEATKDSKFPLDFFFPSVNPLKWRIHEGRIAQDIRSKKIANLLHGRFYSMAPLLFGTKAAKVAARPCEAYPEPIRLPDGPNYLRDTLKSSLATGEGCFDLLVQKQGDPEAMPVEDATVLWDESESPFVKIATITIPKQAFDSDDQEAFCEELSFTPWHAVPEHRPLGGLNRARKVVYETSMKVRQQANGLPRSVEPKSLSIPKR